MKNRVVVQCLFVVTVTVTLSGCGLFKVREKDEAAVGKIRKVAVVGFSAFEPAPSSLSLNVNTGRMETAPGGAIIPQYSDSTQEMYEGLRKALTQNMRWEVLEAARMISKPGYQTAYDKTMKGLQSKMPPTAGFQKFAVKDLMDSDSGRMLGVDGRDALIDGLEVDSIVVAQVDVTLTGSTVIGMGPRHPQSKVSFQVYSRGAEKPVWFDGSIDGEATQESVGTTGPFDEKLLGQLAAQSAQTAFQKIGIIDKL
jgi:hypothetical protein